MKKEKHVLTNPYNHHALSRYIDVYEVSANRCHSVPESGYKGTEATLVDDDPAWNEKFSSYSITGATLTGNNFIIDNDVTAQANYETAKNVTLETDGHGTITATPMSGFIGTNVTLSNTPNAGYTFSSYELTGATLTGNQFVLNNDVTAKVIYEAPYNETGTFNIENTDLDYMYKYRSGLPIINGETIVTVPKTGMILTWDITAQLSYGYTPGGSTNTFNLTAGIMIDNAVYPEQITLQQRSVGTNTDYLTGSAIVNNSFMLVLTGFAYFRNTVGHCQAAGTFRLFEP